ncbi:NAD(P)-binding protein [Daldinia caldariorum]|uniref:NAD(P)-binding protein n=1 Tax=Daldinia caldariorum TaxID=326644 RepID=UPI002008A8BB|nr:NAD(P)-binding protein [Daldinia caldariorum]KAI1471989.1 NAD(P)-binding protein [Daldinia caldariorum]
MADPYSVVKQALFSGKPTFTEKDVPDLTGKVTIVTGSNTGVGKEIARILYSKNARVYLLARSEEKTQAAIESIRAANPESRGELSYIHLDLADLPSVRTTAEEFLRRETKLDILFSNAGVAYPAKGSKTKQGYELQLGVNALGTFALTQLLTPTLVSTARAAPPGSVRAIWVSSSAAMNVDPKTLLAGVRDMESQSGLNKYFLTKLGNYLHAAEFAKRHAAADGVLSASLNPGNLDSELWRTQGPVARFVLRKTILYPAVYGAYTALYAGLSPHITADNSGAFVVPWGKIHTVSKAMADASARKSEGGSGIGEEFWKWSEEEIKKYI